MANFRMQKTPNPSAILGGLCVSALEFGVRISDIGGRRQVASQVHPRAAATQKEAELRFVGSLATAGCDHAMLPILLSGLQKPYAYDGNRLYYDWLARRWRVLPDPRAHPEAIFTEWLDTLVAAGDVNSLTGIVELGQDALDRVRVQTAPAELDQPR